MKLGESVDELWFQFKTVATSFREPNARWKEGSCSKMEKEQKFRVNRAGSFVNVQTLGIYVVLMCSLEIEKSITGHIRREGMRWKLS